jgi:hypothetical protein
MSPHSQAMRVEESTRKPSLRYAWYVVIVLMACFALSFIDRQILSLLVGPIKTDLGISDTRIGLLQGLAFALFYTAMGLPLGRIADTWSRRGLIAVSIMIWSCFTAACSFARTFASLFVTRIGVGIGEAGLSPAAYSMIADYFVKEQLGVAMSVYYMGVFIGSSLALLLGGLTIDAVAKMASITLPIIGSMAPWRLTFLVVALPGIPFALLMYTIKEPVRRDLLRAAGGANKLGISEGASNPLEVRDRYLPGNDLPVDVYLCFFGLDADAFRARSPLDTRTGRPEPWFAHPYLRMRRNVRRGPIMRFLVPEGPRRCRFASGAAQCDRGRDSLPNCASCSDCCLDSLVDGTGAFYARLADGPRSRGSATDLPQPIA